MQPRILVTGATGTVGSELLRQLLARQVPVKALVRGGQGSRPADREGVLHDPMVEVVTGDLDQPESLPGALAGIERVFVLTPTSPRQPALEGNLVECARQAGIRQIVKLSVLGAHSESPATLLKWHGLVEQKIEATGVPYIHLRPNLFMQNLLRSAPLIASQGMITSSTGETGISWIDVRDIAAVATKVLTEEGHEGRTYDLTGPESISYGQIAEKLSAMLGKQITYASLTDVEYWHTIAGSGRPAYLTHALTTLNQFYRQGGGAPVTGNVEIVTQQPARTMDAFLAEHLERFKGK
ncbi:MAG: SDR family oxidoreductase [Chloroflexi bacterium]|nr:SDR family oxidoreductase [Chloroflexota bacterium]